MDPHSISIMLTLIRNGDMTTYRIARETKISDQQVRHKLIKLENLGVVKPIFNDITKKTMYRIHKVFNDNPSMKEINKYISKIAKVIDKIELTTPESMQGIMDFMIDRLHVLKE